MPFPSLDFLKSIPGSFEGGGVVWFLYEQSLYHARKSMRIMWR